ncbi:MAG TPA: phosphopantetheine-binding protein [Tissierellaceae bacterium]|nr:phosphopantetheine-binding protein [Tissierellaceae bacterium]
MLKLISNTIQEYAEVDESDIQEGTHFIQDLNLTSYDIVSMIGKLESDLGVEIPDREIRELETVGDLLGYIKKLV